MSRLPAGLRTRVDGLRRSARALRAELTSPLPVVGLRTRRAVPGWAVRLLLAGLSVGALVLLQPAFGLLIVLLIVLAVLLVRPSGSTAAVWCVACGVAWTVLPFPFGPATFVLLALVAAAFGLATTIAGVPVLARVELAALRPGLVRYGLAQLVAQPVVAAALALRAQRLDLLPGAVIATLAAAVIAWIVLPRLADE